MGLVYTTQISWSLQVLPGPSRYWHESPICDKLEHQKGVWKHFFFLECIRDPFKKRGSQWANTALIIFFGEIHFLSISENELFHEIKRDGITSLHGIHELQHLNQTSSKYVSSGLNSTFHYFDLAISTNQWKAVERVAVASHKSRTDWDIDKLINFNSINISRSVFRSMHLTVYWQTVCLKYLGQ